MRRILIASVLAISSLFAVSAQADVVQEVKASGAWALTINGPLFGNLITSDGNGRDNFVRFTSVSARYGQLAGSNSSFARYSGTATGMIYKDTGKISFIATMRSLPDIDPVSPSEVLNKYEVRGTIKPDFTLKGEVYWRLTVTSHKLLSSTPVNPPPLNNGR